MIYNMREVCHPFIGYAISSSYLATEFLI
uniref:Uncharacterized protein n=1 Tax=Arundo donax TaxID=35708 RepID=A0A0A9DN42_ARUDO